MSRPGSPSLLFRTNLILAASASLIALIATIALNYLVIEPIARRSADDEAGLLVLSAQTWVELPPEARPFFELELAENHDLIVRADVQDIDVIEPDVFNLELLRESLSARLQQSVELRQIEGDDLLWVNVPMGGFDLQIGFSTTRLDIQPLYVGIAIVVFGAGVVFLASIFIVRRIARPLGEVAARVEQFRGNEDFDPVPEEGPRELVSLARNFNTMARDITALLANRTTLLAGISHDLRTPLTRMRIALELLPDGVDPKLQRRFERNLEAMDELIGDALQFARGTAEEPSVVDLDQLITQVCRSFEVPFEGQSEARFLVAENAFRRVLGNLVQNGIQHGEQVSVTREGGRVRVSDKGPGIDEEYRKRVFEPFFRIDSARSAQTGGSGLGLAIVKQLCDAHGWGVSIASTSVGTTVEIDLQMMPLNHS